MRRNEYFEQMWSDGVKFESKKRAWVEMKETILAKYGFESEAYKAIANESPEYPFNDGEVKACRAYKNSMNREGIMQMNDHLWEAEIEDFVKALRSAGVKKFVVTNQSTSLMANIYGFEACGCKMRGIKTLHVKDESYGIKNVEEIRGILFVVKGEKSEDKVDEFIEKVEEEVEEETKEEAKEEKKTRKSRKAA